MKNLIGEFAARDLRIDLLRIRNHGPHLEKVPENVKLIDLGTSHVNSSLPALVRYLRRNKPAALLADKDKLNRTALWARRIAGVPTRVAVRIGTTVSDNLARRSWLDRNLQYFSFSHFYPWADAILVPSQGAADDLAQVSGIPVERITVVPSPVINDRLFALAAEPVAHPWFASGQPPVILGVGELCARKDFATLVRAFDRIQAERDMRLIILGEGRQRLKLEEMVESLGLSGKVDLPGFVNNPYAYMAKAAIFALTSRCEGAPVVLMEALGLGTQTVSTDCPSGPREILQDGRFGRLVPIGDDAALAEALLASCHAPNPPDELRLAAGRYTVSASADAYLEAMGVRAK